MGTRSRQVWVIKPSDLGPSMPLSSDDLRLQPLGTLEEVQEALSTVLGEVTWLDPWAAIVDGDGWMAEISVRVGQPIQELTLQIHGRVREPEDAFDTVRILCAQTGWHAVDTEAWEIVA